MYRATREIRHPPGRISDLLSSTMGIVEGIHYTVQSESSERSSSQSERSSSQSESGTSQSESSSSQSEGSSRVRAAAAAVRVREAAVKVRVAAVRVRVAAVRVRVAAVRVQPKAWRCKYGNILTRPFQRHHARCVRPPCSGENRLRKSSQGLWCGVLSCSKC